MITIKAPIISESKTHARLSATVVEEENGAIESKTLYYEVDLRYKSYLNDRSDAFVVALFYWAMVYHHDITCEAPLTERLHFQLEQTLGPILAHHSTRIHAPKIYAPLTAEVLETAGAVGTGCSCGIDSFHAIVNHYQPRWSSLKLTHLCTFSVGHYYEHVNNPETMAIVAASEYRAEVVAKELNLEIIHVHSNYNELFPQTLIYMAVYADMACVHVLGKLFSTYFYASPGNCHFALKNRECKSSSHYDILSLPCLSTPSLMFYSEGAGVMRWDKTAAIADNNLTHKYLNVCAQEFRFLGASDGVKNRNCGICSKCIRTLLDLEVSGKIDKFRDAFDIDAYFTKNRRLCLRYLLKCHLAGDLFIKKAWEKLHKEIKVIDYIAEYRSILRLLRNCVRNLFRIERVPRFKDPRKK